MKPLPVLFAQEGQASAPAPAEGAKPQQSAFLQFLPLIAIGLLFFVVILPSMRRQRREQEQMASSLKRGLKVATSSGIVGTIVNIKDGEPELVIRSEDAKIRVLRTAVTQVLGQDENEK